MKKKYIQPITEVELLLTENVMYSTSVPQGNDIDGDGDFTADSKEHGMFNAWDDYSNEQPDKW